MDVTATAEARFIAGPILPSGDFYSLTLHVDRIMTTTIRSLSTRGCFYSALVGCLLYSAPTLGDDSDDVNAMCPVLQDRAATADYAITYKGKEVRFCCSECVVEFQENPEIYENAVPQLQDLPLRHQLKLFLGNYGGLLISAVLLLILVTLRVYRWKHPIATTPPNSAVGRMFAKRISPVIPLIALAGYLGYEVWSLQHQLHLRQLEDELHYATFYDFGYPPVPRRPQTEKRLSASFYRGNDERSPKLFNEGNYRTATFHISLCDAEGQVVDTQSAVGDSELFVRLEVDRPPFTPDFLYCPEMMNTMFLTTECDRFLGANRPVQDRITLTEIEPMQRWEARYPLKRKPTCCSGAHGERLRGTIYVCQEQYADGWLSILPKKRTGSRFHYGIGYDLQISEQKLTTESDVYMGALYRTRKLPTWRVPMDQWFSHRPIPELPGRNVSDPKLLGITDHVAAGLESESTAY